MKKIHLNILYSLLLTGCLTLSCSKKEEGLQLPYDYSNTEPANIQELISKAEWKSKSVANGIDWKHFQFPNIFDSRQYVNIIEVDLSNGFNIDIPYVKTGFLKTSEAAVSTNALIAFNGSYFNTTTGGSTVFFKKNGEVLNQTNNGFNTYRENGALVINANGLPSIISKPTSGWSSIAQPTGLAGGPLLIVDGQQLEQQDVAFNINRHPRTAIGITADNKMIIVTVDGRSSQSQGLTIPQLSDLMKALGCTSALNYDGGGSTTAWVKNEGIVNFPSDNGKFDHEGERGVATVFTIK